MTTPRRYSQLVTIVIRLRTQTVRLLGAIVVAVSAYLAAPTPAAATPTDYILSPALMTVFATGTDTITGTFTFDPADSENDSVDFTVTAQSYLENTTSSLLNLVQRSSLLPGLALCTPSWTCFLAYPFHLP
jgi:hypothetical protein